MLLKVVQFAMQTFFWAGEGGSHKCSSWRHPSIDETFCLLRANEGTDDTMHLSSACPRMRYICNFVFDVVYHKKERIKVTD